MVIFTFSVSDWNYNFLSKFRPKNIFYSENKFLVEVEYTEFNCDKDSYSFQKLFNKCSKNVKPVCLA